MRGFAIYPLWVWLGLIAVVSVCLIVTDPMLALFLYMGAVLLPAARDYFLNPMGREFSPYTQWLKTVPYATEKNLPNGSPLPGYQDLVFVSLYCISFARLDVYPYNLALLVVGVLCVIMGIFSLITARHLLNLGPQWLGYAILFILLLSFGTLKLLMKIPSIWVLALPVATVSAAFLTANVGFRLMLKQYQWSSLPQPELRNNAKSLKELIYGHSYSQLNELGQPFTSLSPKAKWPRLPSTHVWGISLLAAALDLIVLVYAPMLTGVMFTMIALTLTIARSVTYYGSRNLALPAWGLVPPLAKKRIPWKRRLSVSIILLVTMIMGCVITLTQLPPIVAIVLEPVTTLFVCVATFRLPPSRVTWETTGLSAVNIKPPYQPASRKQIIGSQA